MMKTKGYNWLTAIILIILVVAIVLMFQGFSDKEYGTNLTVGFVGALISAAITLMLLREQTNSEDATQRSKQLHINKVSAYRSFNKVLWSKQAEDFNKEYFETLRADCLTSLMVFLPHEKLEDLATILYNANKNNWNLKRQEISKLLKEDLMGRYSTYDCLSQRVLNFVKSCYCRVKRFFMGENVTDQKETIKKIENGFTNIISKLEQDDENNNANKEISENMMVGANEIKKEMNEDKETMLDPNITYWHFSALEPDVQKTALKRDEPFVQLIEYGENWRTERLKQVKNGDIIFLFNRGGAGYVGMYRAIRTEVLELSSNDGVRLGKLVTNGEVSNENVSLEEFVNKGLDIYEAIEDGADYISNIFVEPIKVKEEGHSDNPIGTIRPTILRIGEENTKILLDYFNKE